MLVSQTEWARSRGFSPQYVQRLIKRGIVTLKAGKKIDKEEADAALDAIAQPAKARNPGDGTQVGGLADVLLKTRVRLGLEQAKRLELKNKVESGEYLPAREVEESAFNSARITRDAILNIPDRIAALLAAESDAMQVHKILTEELRRALENLAHGNASAESE